MSEPCADRLFTVQAGVTEDRLSARGSPADEVPAGRQYDVRGEQQLPEFPAMRNVEGPGRILVRRDEIAAG